MNELLKLMENNAKLTPAQLAVMLDKNEEEITAEIKKYEEKGIILGYKTLINWEVAGGENVRAIIELKVTPQRGEGFDKIAERIYQYENVSSVWLMSGGFDIALIVEGKTMKEVAMFVAEKLSPMENVISTATHFVLKTYKDGGTVFESKHPDERGKVSL